MKPPTNQKQQPKYRNPYETLGELGKDTVKKIERSVNPLADLFENKGGTESTHEMKGTLKKLEHYNKPQSHTPLDFLGLQKSYEQQDSVEAERLKQRFFKQYNNSVEEAILKSKKKEEEKKRQEAQEEQEKKRLEHEKNLKDNEKSIPMGRVRRSILGNKNRKANVAFENKGQTGR